MRIPIILQQQSPQIAAHCRAFSHDAQQDSRRTRERQTNRFACRLPLPGRAQRRCSLAYGRRNKTLLHSLASCRRFSADCLDGAQQSIFSPRVARHAEGSNLESRGATAAGQTVDSLSPIFPTVEVEQRSRATVSCCCCCCQWRLHRRLLRLLLNQPRARRSPPSTSTRRSHT